MLRWTHRVILAILISLILLVFGELNWATQRYNQTQNMPTVAVLMLPSDTPTGTPTDTVTPTLTPTATDTATATPSATATPPLTFTPSATRTATSTPTATVPPVVTATSGPGENTATPEPDLSTDFTPPPPALANPCISLVGDSVTHGGVTYEIPATGYIVGLTDPLSVYVERALRQRGITGIKVNDRGASHTGISSPNHPSYFKTSAYRALLFDHCQTIMIMPWLNDISPGLPASVAAPQHVRALIGLVRQLAAGTPQARIVVLNYFHGAVASFAAQTWASGFTPENVDLYNHEIGLSCTMGSLSQIPQVACANIDEAFEGFADNSYVITWISHQGLTDALVAPLNPIQQAWLDQYFAVHPDGLLQGDGVHLSVEGKSALADFLVSVMQ